MADQNNTPQATNYADMLLPIIEQTEQSGDTAVSTVNGAGRTLQPGEQARGRYQITADTARTHGLDPAKLGDPVYAQNGARIILNKLAARYNGSIPAILAAYNGGPGRGDALMSSGYDISVLPQETQNYLIRAAHLMYGRPQSQPQAQPLAQPAQVAPPDDLVDVAPQAPQPSGIAPPDDLVDVPAPKAANKTPPQGDHTRTWTEFFQGLMGGTNLPNPKAPQDTWAQQGGKFVENIPAMLENTLGGIARSVGTMRPTANIPLTPGEEEEIFSNYPTPEQIVKTPGTLAHAGAAMSAEATKKLKENAPNVPGASWQGFAQNVGQSGVQMAPGLIASLVTKSPTPFVIEASAAAYGDAYSRATQEGRSDEQASGIATIDAAATALSFKAMEFMPFKHSVGTVTNEVTGEVANVYKRTFGDMIKNLTTQGVAVQPAISIANTVLENVASGKDPTEGLPGPLLQTGIVNTIMMGAGHLAGGNRPFMGESKKPIGEAYAYDPSAEPGRGRTWDNGAPQEGPGQRPGSTERQALQDMTPPADGQEPTHGTGRPVPPPSTGPRPPMPRTSALDDYIEQQGQAPAGPIEPPADLVDVVPDRGPASPVSGWGTSRAARLGQDDLSTIRDRSDVVQSGELPVKGKKLPGLSYEIFRDPQTGLYHYSGDYEIPGLAGGSLGNSEGFETPQDAADHLRTVGARHIAQVAETQSGRNPAAARTATRYMDWLGNETGTAARPEPPSDLVPASAIGPESDAATAAISQVYPDWYKRPPEDSTALQFFQGWQAHKSNQTVPPDAPEPFVQGYEARNNTEAQQVVSEDQQPEPEKQGRLRGVRAKRVYEDAASILANRGGIRNDEGHDLVAGRGLQQFVPGAGPLIRPNGMSIDEAGKHLWDEGFFGPPDHTPRPTENDVLQLLEKTAGRNKIYPPEMAVAKGAAQSAADVERQNAEAEQEVCDIGRELGEAFTDEDVDGVMAIMARDGMDAESAVVEYSERLAIQTVDDLAQETGDETYHPIPFEGAGREPSASGEGGEGHARVEENPPESGAGGEPVAEDRQAPRQPAEEVGAEGLPQTILPGAEPSAKQLAAARESTGHGLKTAKAPQKEPAGGLFAPAEEPEADMFAAPQRASASREKHQEIGKNAKGATLYEDERGVRSYVENGIRISEPVGFVPGSRDITVDHEAHPEFLTTEERPPKEEAPVKAEPRRADDRGNPIFKEGERVIIPEGNDIYAGRHGTVTRAAGMRSVTLFPSRGMKGEETSYHYEVKTDQGDNTLASKLEPETERPKDVVPDPIFQGKPIHPSNLSSRIAAYQRDESRYAEDSRNARKPEKKREWSRLEQDARAKALDGRRVLNEWKAAHPNEFARVFGTNPPEGLPEPAHPTAENPPTPSAEPTQGGGVTVSENEARNGIEVKFNGKPTQEVINRLKSAGFRWSGHQKLWYAKRNERTRAAAKAIQGTPQSSQPQVPAALSTAREELLYRLNKNGEAARNILEPDGRNYRIEPTSPTTNGVKWLARKVAPNHVEIGQFDTRAEAANAAVDLALKEGSGLATSSDALKPAIDPEAIKALRHEYPNAKDPIVNSAGRREGSHTALNFLSGWDRAKAGQPSYGMGASEERTGYDAYVRTQPLSSMDDRAFERALATTGVAERNGTWRIIPDVGSGYAVEHTVNGSRETLRADQDDPTWTLAEARDKARKAAFKDPGKVVAAPAAQEHNLPQETDNAGQRGRLQTESAEAPSNLPAEAVPGGGEGRQLEPAGGQPRGGDREHGEPVVEPGAGEPTERTAGRPDRAEEIGPSDGGERRAEGMVAQGRGERVQDRPERRVRGLNYRQIGDISYPKSPATRAEANMAAIEVLKRLEDTGAPPTVEDQDALARYIGWGGAAQIFDEANQKFSAQRDRLKALLTPEQYDAARLSTINAHYTSPDIVKAIWHGMQELGFAGEGAVLEPGMGVGNFLSLRPDGVEPTFTGVELDDVTGRVARALFPQAQVHIKGFEETKIPENTFDAVVGNVPFANIMPADKQFNPKRNLSLHNYFINKSIHLMKPGAVMGVITTHYTMDSADSTARKTFLDSGADLIGAVRLPDTAFKENAGTEVVTDILFFRKRKPGEKPAPANWLQAPVTKVADGSARINQYFLDHPENVLGEHALTGAMYAKDSYTVSGTSDQIGERAQNAMTAIAAAAKADHRGFGAEIGGVSKAAENDLALAPGHVKDGAYFEKDGKVYQRAGEVAHVASIPQAKQAMVRSFIKMRDLARETLAAQRQVWDGNGASPWAKPQAALNKEYDAFVRANGPINKVQITERTMPDGEKRQYRRYPNLNIFRDDPDMFLVSAVERFDEETGQPSKAPIMSERVLEPTKEIIRANTPEEALIASMNMRGKVDMPYMSRLLSMEPDAVATSLPGRVYRDPTNGSWQLAEMYLSGDVRAKLKAAQALAKKDKAYEENVKALEAIQPPDLKPSDIDVRLGASWVPESDVKSFVESLLGGSADVRYTGKTASWSLDISDPYSVANRREWGVDAAPAQKLIADALNQRSTTVTYTDPDGKTHTDVQKTVVAQEKQQQIRDKFSQWVWEDPARAKRLSRYYNDNFNNLVTPKYNGDHLELPGSSKTIKLRSTQKKAVWRFLTSGNTLLDHVVGSGKTFTSIAAGMEAKRVGIIKKSVYSIPNHMLEQFSREFLQMYPSANILVADKDNFSGDRRRHFVARAAAGNWDAIIMTHSAFEMVPTSSEYQAKFIKQDIAEYEALIREEKRGRNERTTIKELEKSKKRREEKLKALRDAKDKDRGITFEEMGADALFVDESQLFKNLEVATKSRGLGTSSSQRAFDLYMKTRLIDEMSPGKGVMFLSGTPISNSMAEMYTLQRYLGHQGLAARGLAHFDAWAAAFGDMVTKPEISPDGMSARLKTRFARFRNIPELVQMYRQFADLVTTDDLLATGVVTLPKVAGGKAQSVDVPASGALLDYVKNLAERAEKVKGRQVDPSVDNMLKISGDGRKAALDMRLVDPSAAPDPSRKAIAVADKIAKIWDETRDKRSTQIAFLDLSTPNPVKFNVYDDIRQELIKRGVPAKEIAFVHSADTDEKKGRLFADVRDGRIRVLLGSTEKMGVGTNVQTRLVALHDIDCPWRPSDLEQRHGRIIRQGNLNDEVQLYNYVTVGSFDAYSWQTVERKARFISQIKAGDPTVRHAEDIDDTALTYAEVKALASGNPLILKKAQVDADLDRLTRVRRAFNDGVRQSEWDLHAIPGQIESAERQLVTAKKDAAAYKPVSAEKFTAEFGGKTFDKRADAAKALGKEITGTQAAAQQTGEPTERKIGKFGGFDVSVYTEKDKEPCLVVHQTKDKEVDIVLATAETGALTRLENHLRSIPGEPAQYQGRIDRLKRRGDELKTQVGKKFDREDKYQALLVEQKHIDDLLGVNGDQAQQDAQNASAGRRSRQEPGEGVEEAVPQSYEMASPGRQMDLMDEVARDVPAGVEPQAGIRDYILSRGRVTGNESLVAYDLGRDAITHAITDNERAAVQFTPSLKRALMNPDQAVVTHHNHPNSLGPSVNDLVSLGYLGHRYGVIHAADGNWHGAGLTPEARASLAGEQRQSGSIFMMSAIVNQAYQGVGEKVRGLIRDGVIDRETAWRIDGTLVATALDRAGIIDYSTSDPIPEALEPLVQEAILFGARKAATQAAALKVQRDASRLELPYRPSGPVRYEDGMGELSRLTENGWEPSGDRGGTAERGIGNRAPDLAGGPRGLAEGKNRYIKTPEFRRWFGSSKIVGIHGKPLVVYHGTNAETFEQFSPSKGKTFVWGQEYTVDRPVAFFTDNKDFASTFGKNIIPAYLKIENPIDLRDGVWGADPKVLDLFKDQFGANAGFVPPEELWEFFDSVDNVQALRDFGYDGALLGERGPDGKMSDVFVPFDPKQIKSATGNRGTFDPNDSNILREGEDRYAGEAPTGGGKPPRPPKPPKPPGGGELPRRGPRQPQPTPAQAAKGNIAHRQIEHILGPVWEGWADKAKNAAARIMPDTAADLLEEAKLAVTPMAAGSERGRAVAKDFITALRNIRWQWDKVDQYLQNTLTRDQQTRIYNAMDEEGTAVLEERPAREGKGVDSLTPQERAIAVDLNARASANMRRAIALGMTTAKESLPWYVPRMIVRMTETGGAERVGKQSGPSGKDATNLHTTTPQMKHRKYRTIEETEEAARKKFGEEAVVVRNIRTLALATRMLEEAIAGRTLVNKIKDFGKDAGVTLVEEGSTRSPDHTFTIDHPAMRTMRPVGYTVDEETGKKRAIEDENGHVILESVPLYINKEFEGPLKAVLSTDSNQWYKGLMALKGKSMAVIMWTPLMHNAVIWGKAFPAAPLQLITPVAYRGEDGTFHWGIKLYVDGRMAKQDPELMGRAIKAGMDPIGRRYFNQDITSIAEEAQLVPGRSWTAKAIGNSLGLFDKDLGEKSKEAIDKFGDVWHNKYLWDLVADLQVGLFKTISEHEARRGLPQDVADQLAADFANQYAGALPIEAMSKASRMLANIIMFSRSFTLSNLKAFKTMVSGLPLDTQARILRDHNVDVLNRAQGVARRKAISLIIMDVAMMHVGLFLAAGAMSLAWYALTGTWKWHPSSENEPGKENKVFVGYNKQGTAIYARIPTGKVGEDLMAWGVEPRNVFLRKLSPYSRLLYEVASNDKGFGHKLFDEKDKSAAGWAQSIGAVVGQGMTSVLPLDSIQTTKDMLSQGQYGEAAASFALPAIGITLSKGYPGGPALGEYNALKERHDFKVQQEMPDIMRQLRLGQIDEARARMTELGIPPGLQRYYAHIATSTGRDLSRKKRKDLGYWATPEDMERIDRARKSTAEERSQ